VIHRSYARLRQRGFEIVEASNCYVQCGNTAGSIRERVNALHALFEDPSVDALVAFWGGLHTHQLIEYIDYDLIKRNPKPLVGYSDVTALELALLAQTGLVTFLGPGGVTFGKPVWFDYTWRSFARVALEPEVPLRLEASESFSDDAWWESGETGEEAMTLHPTPPWRCVRPGVAEGHVIAGTLGVLLLLWGTPWMPSLDGAILFVEEDEAETPGTVGRMFTHLRHTGALGRIAALVVGRLPRSIGLYPEHSLDTILEEVLVGYDLPVLVDVDFGHTDPLLTLPQGVRCRVDATSGSIILLEGATEAAPSNGT